MPRLTEMTVGYEVARSRDFQSVRCSGSVTFELIEGEDKTEAITKTRRWLAAQMNDSAQEELENVLFGPKGGL
jgi:hypothetical protein